jgi:hypothetical protein
MLQGLALGGEYGGAATYVAEHAPGRPPRLLHLVDPDHRDARPVPVAGRHPHHPGIDVEGNIRRLGLAHSVPAVVILLGISVWIRLSLSTSRRHSSA